MSTIKRPCFHALTWKMPAFTTVQGCWTKVAHVVNCQATEEIFATNKTPVRFPAAILLTSGAQLKKNQLSNTLWNSYLLSVCELIVEALFKQQCLRFPPNIFAAKEIMYWSTGRSTAQVILERILDILWKHQLATRPSFFISNSDDILNHVDVVDVASAKTIQKKRGSQKQFLAACSCGAVTFSYTGSYNDSLCNTTTTKTKQSKFDLQPGQVSHE